MSAWSLEDVPDQTGRTAIVTGSNSGIGFEAALGLALKGARVVLACRNPQKGEEALNRIRAAVPGAKVELEALDLADLGSARAFSERFRAQHQKLDLLVNNAGVMVPPLTQTRQGFELQFGTNHLGHFALTGHLLPLLQATPGARVVVVYSGVHWAGKIHFADLNYQQRRYRPWEAYSQSKLANLLFALELQRRLAGAAAPIVTCAHPGWTATELQRNVSLASIFNPILAMKTPDGALPTLRAATDPGAGPGSYWGPAHLFEMRGPPVAGRVSSAARDLGLAARLWEVSEQLTGVRYPLAPSAAA